MTHLYLDASALAKLVIFERETPELRGAVRDRSIATSRVAVVEVTKAAARAGPEADPSQILSLVTLLAFDARVASLAAVTGGPALRACARCDPHRYGCPARPGPRELHHVRHPPG